MGGGQVPLAGRTDRELGDCRPAGCLVKAAHLRDGQQVSNSHAAVDLGREGLLRGPSKLRDSVGLLRGGDAPGPI
eukprot:5243680-Alexandrium_andersonii.AAC.1